MLQQEENKLYEPYPFLPQHSATTPVENLDVPQTPAIPSEQNASELPWSPLQPEASPPAKRPRNAAAIFILTFVLAIILGVGLFAAGTYVSGGGTSTTSKTGATSSASVSSTSTLETQQEAAIATIEPAVVELQVTTAQGGQTGSGVIIDTKGDIVTNNHVINGAQNITIVLNTGATEQAQLIGSNPADDLAVVRIAPFTHMTVAQFGDSSKLVVGQEVLAIGNPLGITQTATKGIVSALNRSVTESTGTTISNAIQTDAAVNPGNSGGALINLQGQFVGIPTLTAINTQSNTAANGVSFAIPSNLVETAVQQIILQANG